jgi:hypothetical protein
MQAYCTVQRADALAVAPARPAARQAAVHEGPLPGLAGALGAVRYMLLWCLLHVPLPSAPCPFPCIFLSCPLSIVQVSQW